MPERVDLLKLEGLKELWLHVTERSNLACSHFVLSCVVFGAWTFSAEAAERNLVAPKPYAKVLAEAVKGDLVDYRAVIQHKEELQNYLTGVGKADLDGGSTPQKLAFYINAYNAYTLQLILKHYEEGIDSIRDIKQPWNWPEWKVAGEMLSLDGVEHQRLRKHFDEPRIHCAVNCASLGCSPLLDNPYLAAKIDEQLVTVTQDFLQGVEMSVKNPLFGKKKGVLHLNKILKCYGADFEPSLLAWIEKHAPKELAAFVKKYESIEIHFVDYDWSFNDVNRGKGAQK